MRYVLGQFWELYSLEKDLPLLYEMALLGDRQLPHLLPEKLILELGQHIKPLPKTPPLLYPDSVFRGLDSWDNYDIVGLGEATHGTREFCHVKHRIFKYLVENHNFKVLAYEYSFRKSLIINKYVMDGKGDIDHILNGESWIQNNEEVKELIRWMRNYNQDKLTSDKLRFIGVDTQVDAIRLPGVLGYLEEEHPLFCQSHSDLITAIRELKNIDYASISKEEYGKRKEIFSELSKAAKAYSGPDRNRIVLVAKSLMNSHEFLYSIFILKENPRDQQLADNVLQICSLISKGQKIVVWAHNAHVGSNPDYYGVGLGSMGKFLKDSLQDAYLIIGTAFSKGDFKAVMIDPSGADTPPLTCTIEADPPGLSTNFLLHSSPFNPCVLDLRLIPNSTRLFSYLDSKRPLMGVGDCYLGSPELHFSQDRILNLPEAFDLLFYFDHTHPITLFNHDN
jgi:erythromycin esterase